MDDATADRVLRDHLAVLSSDLFELAARFPRVRGDLRRIGRELQRLADEEKPPACHRDRPG